MRVSVNLVANVMIPFTAPGNFFRVQSLNGVASHSLSVTFFKDHQRVDVDLTDVDAGDWAEIPGGFDRFEVVSTETQTAVIQVANSPGARVGSDRITGDVSVIDGALSSTLALDSFLGAVGSAGGAALFAHVQLLNPAASGVIAIVEQLGIVVNASSVVQLYRYDAALAVDSGGAPNKYVGAAASLSHLRSEDLAALTGTGSPFLTAAINGGVYTPLSLREPIVLPPGVGLIAFAATANVPLTCSFEFSERAP